MNRFTKKKQAIATLRGSDMLWQADIFPKHGAKTFLVGTLDAAWKYIQKKPCLTSAFGLAEIGQGQGQSGPGPHGSAPKSAQLGQGQMGQA